MTFPNMYGSMGSNWLVKFLYMYVGVLKFLMGQENQSFRPFVSLVDQFGRPVGILISSAKLTMFGQIISIAITSNYFTQFKGLLN